MRVLKRLLVTGALSAISFVWGVTAATVLAWQRRAAPQAHALHAHLRHDRPVTPGQLAAMWRFIRRKQAQQAAPDSARPEGSEVGRQGVWRRWAPACHLILAAFGGPRTLASALPLMQMTAAVALGVPCFCSDGFSWNLSASIKAYHTLPTFPRTGKSGRPKQPVQEPLPELVYGQVVKKQRHGRLHELSIKTRALSARRRAWFSWTIMTAPRPGP